ncbi:MAG: fumarate hydratase [Salinibacterium sp.]|nr:MAG: fumarate hydratase [Salinibacterium sp.]
MTWLLEILAATLGIVLLWGLFAPRSQWRTLASWSTADPHANEPGGGSYGLRRFLCGIGALALGIVVVSTSLAGVVDSPPKVTKTPIQIMWGSPNPKIVNRLVTRTFKPPEGLVAAKIVGYQEFALGTQPHYLGQLKEFTLFGKTDIPGYIGRVPASGYSAADSADMVINVRGPVLCIPRSAVVVETDRTVKIGVYYGLPDSPNKKNVDHVAGCTGDDASVTASVMIPIDLAAPLGKRKVVTVNGRGIKQVLLVEP